MSRGASPAPFVGRQRELGLLAAAFDQVRGGHSGAVVIGGDAGVGKSRLVEEFSASARVAGALVGAGACVPGEGGGAAFGPFLAIWRELAVHVGDEGWAVPWATARRPHDGSLRISRVLDAVAKAELFESVLDGLSAVAEKAAVLLIVEDLQWADSATAELFTYLTRNLHDARVLVVGTYRDEDVGPAHPRREWLDELSRQPRVVSAQLGGLSFEETSHLVAAIIAGTPARSLLDLVWARSQGNPFFVEELATAPGNDAIPDELQRLVLARVGRMTDEARRVVSAASAAVASLGHGLLEAIGAVAPEAVDRAIADAVDSRVLVVDPTSAGYRFRHALLKEAVHNALLPGERRRLHRQLATAMTLDPSLAVHGAAELAWHWWEAGEWRESLDASLAAADEGAAAWAFAEALAHVDRAMGCVTQLAGTDSAPPRRVDLLARASELAYLAGQGRRSVQMAQDAIACVDEGSEPEAAARLWMLLGRNAWSIDDPALAFDAGQRAEALLPVEPPSADLARVQAEQARWSMLMSHNNDAVERCHQAIATARATGARAEEGHALNTLGVARANLGHHEEGIALVRQAVAIAEDLQLPDDLDRAYGNLTAVLGNAGRLDEVVDVVYDSVAGRGALRGAAQRRERERHGRTHPPRPLRRG